MSSCARSSAAASSSRCLRVGVYRVQVGAMTITAGEEDLEVPAPSRKKQGARQTSSSAAGPKRDRASGAFEFRNRRPSTCTG